MLENDDEGAEGADEDSDHIDDDSDNCVDELLQTAWDHEEEQPDEVARNQLGQSYLVRNNDNDLLFQRAKPKGAKIVIQ